ncbi:hypothetical protein JTE90_007553 [Oedothorax gibbosus]|uniref:Uncharacterized protein n=1 Tax=Oedothorax gibbosus TaxID=931172 RepID=A0AAV6VKH7_9ARAC|nr:hypothetical protein JTE90_007553 [Oedothorax gibbosus]
MSRFTLKPPSTEVFDTPNVKRGHVPFIEYIVVKKEVLMKTLFIDMNPSGTYNQNTADVEMHSEAAKY